MNPILLKEKLESIGITPKSVDYKGIPKIALYTDSQNIYIKDIKAITGRLWSQTFKAWLLPRSKESLAALEKLLIKNGLADASNILPLTLETNEEPAHQHHAFDTSEPITLGVDTISDTLHTPQPILIASSPVTNTSTTSPYTLGDKVYFVIDIPLSED